MDDDLFIRINKKMNERNRKAIPDFEGYAPVEMHHLIYEPFGESSPVQWLEMNEPDYEAIPMFKQVKYLVYVIKEEGELQLTKKGHLRTKLVADIYDQGFIKDQAIESGITKLYKETDTNAINLTRILLEISPVVKKRHNKLSLTKKGQKLIQDDHNLLLAVLKTFCMKFNWAYYDGYGQNPIGRMGFGFTFILLKKYGDGKKPASFYAEKYFKAFPHLLDELEPDSYNTKEERGKRCYSLRTFNRFLDYFGLVNIEHEYTYTTPKYVAKTELFDKLIECHPPMNN